MLLRFLPCPIFGELAIFMLSRLFVPAFIFIPSCVWELRAPRAREPVPN